MGEKRGKGKTFYLLCFLAESRAYAIFGSSFVAGVYGVTPWSRLLKVVKVVRTTSTRVLVWTKPRSTRCTPERRVLRIVRRSWIRSELAALWKSLSHAEGRRCWTLMCVFRVLHRIGSRAWCVVTAALSYKVTPGKRVGRLLSRNGGRVVCWTGTVISGRSLLGLIPESPLRGLDAQHSSPCAHHVSISIEECSSASLHLTLDVVANRRMARKSKLSLSSSLRLSVTNQAYCKQSGSTQVSISPRPESSVLALSLFCVSDLRCLPAQVLGRSKAKACFSLCYVVDCLANVCGRVPLH